MVLLPRSRRAVVTLALLVAVLGWGLAVIVSAVSARSELAAAQGQLREVRALVAAGDVEGTASALETAEATLASARRRLHRPHVTLAAQLPYLGRDLRVARSIAAGGHDVAVAAAPVIAAMDAVSGAGERAGLPVAELAALAEPLAGLAAAAADAEASVAASPASVLLAEVRDAREDALALLSPVAHDLDVAARLAGALPDFLGHAGPRTYFLAAANPAELRGVSGYLGAYSIVEVDGGQLTFGPFEELSGLETLPEGAVDDELVPERWRPFRPSQRWKNVNLTPDVPTAATLIEHMWRARTGQELDGVIIVDPFALAALLEVTGPVEGPDGRSVAAGSVVDLLTHESYRTLGDPGERKQLLGDVATRVLSRFLERPDDALRRIDVLGRVVSQRHLVVHATDPVVQDAFAAAGVDGAVDVPDTGDVVMVVGNSATNAKLDWYLDREIAYDVSLGADGETVGSLRTTFHNRAPSGGEIAYVIGPNVDGLETGENRLYVTTYCAATCELLGGRGGVTGNLERAEEHGLASTGAWVEIAPGGAETLEHVWRNPSGWVHADGRLRYEVLVRTQTAVRAPTVTVRVETPDGFTAVAHPEDGTSTEWTGAVRGDVRLRWEFVRSEDATVDAP